MYLVASSSFANYSSFLSSCNSASEALWRSRQVDQWEASSAKASWPGCLLALWDFERPLEAEAVLAGCLEMVHSSGAQVAFVCIFIVSASAWGWLVVVEAAKKDLELRSVQFCLIRDIFTELSWLDLVDYTIFQLAVASLRLSCSLRLVQTLLQWLLCHFSDSWLIYFAIEEPWTFAMGWYSWGHFHKFIEQSC